jgi:hypothetical protein
MGEREEGLPKLFDINTILIVSVLILVLSIIYQLHCIGELVQTKTITVNEFQQPINLFESVPVKNIKKGG